jgi:hypothetical protein
MNVGSLSIPRTHPCPDRLSFVPNGRRLAGRDRSHSRLVYVGPVDAEAGGIPEPTHCG